MTSLRFLTAREYLVQLKRLENTVWIDAYVDFEKNNNEILGLALLHPGHYKELELPIGLSAEKLLREIQGPRIFDFRLAGDQCASQLLWGYECPLHDVPIQQDHLFPFSLGGPTVGANRVPLCRYHNMVKGSDIHCFPWENVTERCSYWLRDQLTKIERRISLYS
jgi:hypothetical protein